MRRTSNLPPRDPRLWTLVVLAVCLPGCGQKPVPAQKTAPAKIEHPNEGDIYRIVLTPKARQRLLITTSPVEKLAVPRTRTVGGEIAIPDGSRVLVTAPLTGTLKPVNDAATLTAGQPVAAGQVLFQLMTLLSPEREVPTAAERVIMANAKAVLVTSQITADGDFRVAQAQVEAAGIALTRAKQLFADKAGSQRDVDDAVARLDIANKQTAAALARKQLLDKLTLEAQTGAVTAVPVRVPQDGILRMVSSSIGQTVSVGVPLFEVVSLKTVWVRVPLYPGLRQQVDLERNALIRDLGGTGTRAEIIPITAPPSADPLAATVDVFYELPNPDGRFHPGERVEVVLPLAGEAESLVVPRAAILRDIHGIAWVYVNSTGNEFRRHRVEVHFTTDEFAVLSHGPDVGVDVVVDGAAELFGTEFGAGK